ncbi:CidA/LrgA family protein [Marinobacterium jannaschii]|uniref:CidA/LrgA family protein n=1 Tax=Marinobacterium jannaschii TaxID=64970 RepID=UPI000686CA11|nr:CidA/LrgA family protein [Marinobacterium jannaschii]
MVIGFLALLLCQLAGELLVVWLELPVPGAVVGMLILLSLLAIRGEAPASVRQAGEGLLSILPLFLVPAGVGLMLHFQLIAANWWSILLALLGSTLITMLVVGVLMKCSALNPGEQGETHER